MAANDRGEIAIVIDGKTYTLVVDTNAMVKLEEMFSQTKEMLFYQVLERVNAGSVTHIRAFVWAALQRHHATEIATPAGAGDLIQAAGGLLKFSEQLAALTATSSQETPR